MAWIEHGGGIQGIKVRGNTYFREFARLLVIAQNAPDLVAWWDRSNLPPAEVFVALDHGRKDKCTVAVRRGREGLRVTTTREVAGMRDMEKQTLRDALGIYAVADFRATLDALRSKAGLGEVPPHPAFPASLAPPQPEAAEEPPVAVLEVHVPLVPGTSQAEDPFSWIEDVEDFLSARRPVGPVTQLDHGEEVGDSYVFPLAGGELEDLLTVAREIAALPSVPAGVYAVLVDSDLLGAGDGQRLELDDP